MPLDTGTYGAKRQSWESGPRKILRDLVEQHPTWDDNSILATFHCEIQKQIESGNYDNVPHLTAYYGKPNLKALRGDDSEDDAEPETKASPAAAAAAKNRKQGKPRTAEDAKDSYVPSVFDTRIMLDGRAIGDISYAEIEPLIKTGERDVALLKAIHAAIKRPTDSSAKIRDLMPLAAFEKLVKKTSR